MHGRRGYAERGRIRFAVHRIFHDGRAQRFVAHPAHGQDDGLHRLGLLPKGMVADTDADACDEQDDTH